MSAGTVTLRGPSIGNNLLQTGQRFLDAYIDNEIQERFGFDDEPAQLAVDPSLRRSPEQSNEQTPAPLDAITSNPVAAGVVVLSLFAVVVLATR